jgi:hypothetical protein
MKSSNSIPLHLVRIGAITALIALCILYPFLPGAYDRLAVGLSTTAQVLGVLGLLLVPVGALWLISELRQPARKQRRYSFALAAVIAGGLVAAAASLIAFATAGLSFGLLALALWAALFIRFIPGLKRLKIAQGAGIHPAPLYLILLPLAVTLFQILFAAPLTDFSRSRAIANSAELIRDIEAYHTAHGRYPAALQAVWKDYDPSVVGIEKYHYAPNGDAYHLYFEQPRFLFDNIGTREFVVYNKLDEHAMVSHTAWILQLPPEELQTSQGWYAVHDAPTPHWKYFWFD